MKEIVEKLCKVRYNMIRQNRNKQSFGVFMAPKAAKLGAERLSGAYDKNMEDEYEIQFVHDREK